MNDSKRQYALILILILALFLHMEGFTPNLFAASDVPASFQDETGGIEFKALVEGDGFTRTDALLIKASFTNIGKEPIGYYAGSTTEGHNRVAGAALYSVDKSSRFSDKLTMEKQGEAANCEVFSGDLMPGEAITIDFSMVPFYKQNGVVKLAKPGEYVLSFWFSAEGGQVIKTDFPVTIVKRFGRMYIKGK